MEPDQERVAIGWRASRSRYEVNAPLWPEELALLLEKLRAAGISAVHEVRSHPLLDWDGSVAVEEPFDVFLVPRSQEKQARQVLKKIRRRHLRREEGENRSGKQP
jgi:hypothetical protein